MQEIKTKASGKLYFLGEFSVVDGGNAVLFPVDSYVNVTIKESDAPFNADEDLLITKAAINISEKYLKELGIDIKNYSLNIENELIDKDSNVKYGLGSSAAIMVSIIESILLFHNVQLSKLELFKLSVLANYSLKKNGSMGDIATSVWQEPIIYKTFNKKELIDRINNNENINAIMKEEWDGLKIARLNFLSEDNNYYKLIIGWTKKSADTHDIVSQFNDFMNKNPNYLNNFLLTSNEIIEDFINAKSYFDVEIQMNRFSNLLNDLQSKSNIEIITEEARKMINAAHQIGVASKTSGAGNGDCVIALSFDKEKTKRLEEKWTKLGAEVLNINVKWR